jgi:hypothetical protein
MPPIAGGGTDAPRKNGGRSQLFFEKWENGGIHSLIKKIEVGRGISNAKQRP